MYMYVCICVYIYIYAYIYIYGPSPSARPVLTRPLRVARITTQALSGVPLTGYLITGCFGNPERPRMQV